MPKKLALAGHGLDFPCATCAGGLNIHQNSGMGRCIAPCQIFLFHTVIAEASETMNDQEGGG